MDKLKMESVDLTAQNIDKIGELFPNCITETADEKGKLKKAINFDMLKQMLSDEVAEGDEAYEFTWVGKKEAIVKANKPIRKTLRPCKEESVDWDTTENLYIEGDNLKVLKLLQESYLGKVKMIYIDPPYNTGSDRFVYTDDFRMTKEEYKEFAEQIDENGNVLFKENTESNPHFHSVWCSMIYSRLMLARNLLSDDGVIFISIDDNEVDNLRKICDEIFGTSNFIAEFPRVTKRGGKSTETYAKNHDYIICYCKNIEDVRISGVAHVDEGFKYKDEYYDDRGAYKLNQTLDYDTLGYINSLDYPIIINDITYYPGGVSEQEYKERKHENPQNGYRWRWSKDLFDFGYKNGWIEISKSGRIYTKTYLKAKISKKTSREYYIEYAERTKAISTLEFIENLYSNDNSNKEITKLMGSVLFDYVKPSKLINLLIKTTTEKDSIVLDFFSGSATTAHAVMQLNAEDGGNRKFIMVQIPEPCDEKSEAFKAGYKNICEIGKERIRRAGKKIKEENPNATNLDTGFRVLKLAETNMTDVYYSPLEINQQMLLEQIENIKPDRNDLDLLFGCLIDWGIPLNMPYVSEKIDGFTVHTYNDGDLIACFDKNISENVIKEIAKRQPLRAVFRDSSFADSPSKINVGEIFKMIAPDTRVRVI